jgi:colanic acid/amylovoran biosynthesis glycosyltransferase
MKQAKKHIGIFVSNPPGYSETFLRSKIQILQERGFRITVFSLKRTDENLPYTHVQPWPMGVKAIYFLLPLIYTIITSLKAITRFWNLQKKEGYSAKDIIKSIYINLHVLSNPVDHLHYEFGTLAISREVLAKAIKAKMTCSFRGFDIAIYPIKHPNCYSKLWKHVDAVHSISDDLIQLVKNQHLPPSIPLIKIEPWIDIEAFPLKSNLGYIDNIPQLLTIGRLHWKKGYTLLLDALYILKQRAQPFHLTIIGGGDEYESLVFQAHQLGLTTDIKFTGRVAHAEVKKYIHANDIYIQPSIQEGFCNAVLEAQASGMLVAVSTAEGLPENLGNGETGWIFEKGNKQQLADTLIEIIKKPKETRMEYAMKAHERAKNNYSIEHQIPNLIAFFS